MEHSRPVKAMSRLTGVAVCLAVLVLLTAGCAGRGGHQASPSPSWAHAVLLPAYLPLHRPCAPRAARRHEPARHRHLPVCK
jgi:hypothetical protein